jgi:hypothetical protein
MEFSAVRAYPPDLGDDLGFADAGRSPEEGGLLDTGQQLQRGRDVRRLHGGTISMTGRRGASLPTPDPSRISLSL